jgi:hypothetical protein
MWVDNRTLESFKMYTRFLYGIFIWYEFILHPDMLDLSEKVIGVQQRMMNLVPLWSASIIMYIVEFTEAFCGNGRLFPQFALFWMGIYIAMYSQEWASRWPKLAMNILMDFLILYNNGIWVQYGQEDFRNYKLHGNYQVGFKRFKA